MSKFLALRGVLRAMRNARGYNRNHDADATFSPLEAWLRTSHWGGTGTGGGLKRSPFSLQTPEGDPSLYLIDNTPFIISQARAINKSLEEDIAQETVRLLEKRRRDLMSWQERIEYNKLMGEQYLDDLEPKTVEELIRQLAEQEYLMLSRGWKPEWFGDDSHHINLTRANSQIRMFADMLQEADFSSVSRGWENPYYGMVGHLLPKSEFPAPRRIKAASPFSRQNLRGRPRQPPQEDVPF